MLVVRRVDGANATLAGHRSTAVPTRNLATWWLSIRCSPACSKKSVPSIPSSQALVLDISQVARAAVATLKRPMKVHRRRRPCANTARGLAAKKTLEDLQAKTTELGEKTREACAELTRAQSGGRETRDTSRQEMDLDETDAQVHEAEAALAGAEGRSQPQNAKRQTPARVRCQPERKLNWTRPSTMPAVLFLVVSLLWEEMQPSQLSRSNGEPELRILSANISSWARRPRVFCGVLRWVIFRW